MSRRITRRFAAICFGLFLAGSIVLSVGADPDTNIQKPGHRSNVVTTTALDEPDTTIQKPGHRAGIATLTALDEPDTNIQKPGHRA